MDVDSVMRESMRKMKWKSGNGVCGGTVIKHFPHFSSFKGFWETVPAICAAPNSPTRYVGRYLGLCTTAAHGAGFTLPSVAIHRIIADFSANC